MTYNGSSEHGHPSLTPEAFLDYYAANSGMRPQELLDEGFVVALCDAPDCDFPRCRGYVVVSRDLAERSAAMGIPDGQIVYPVAD